MIHLQCDYLDEMTAHLLEHHQFSMDKFKTVIYGLCTQCEAAKGKKNSGI
jgi:Fur family ferric uptake transcriptional regulator